MTDLDLESKSDLITSLIAFVNFHSLSILGICRFCRLIINYPSFLGIYRVCRLIIHYPSFFGYLPCLSSHHALSIKTVYPSILRFFTRHCFWTSIVFLSRHSLSIEFGYPSHLVCFHYPSFLSLYCFCHNRISTIISQNNSQLGKFERIWVQVWLLATSQVDGSGI